MARRFFSHQAGPSFQCSLETFPEASELLAQDVYGMVTSSTLAGLGSALFVV